MKDITERNYCREMNEVEKQEKEKIERENEKLEKDGKERFQTR